MNKKHFLMMLIISLPLFFTGCVEDMYEDTTSLEELYRQKAAEFSKKYGVDVTLNEERISEIIQTTSIEKLEADIKEMADFFHNITIKTVKDADNSLKKKMKIARAKKFSEAGSLSGSFTSEFFYRGKVYNGTLYATNLINAEGTGTVEWNFNSGRPNFVKVEVSIRPNVIGASTYQGSCTNYGVAAVSSSSGIKFYVSGSLTLTNSYQNYQITEYFSVNVDEGMYIQDLRFGD